MHEAVYIMKIRLDHRTEDTHQKSTECLQTSESSRWTGTVATRVKIIHDSVLEFVLKDRLRDYNSGLRPEA